MATPSELKPVMPDTMTSIDRYAVFGHPIRHSQSPRIHTLFAEQLGQSLVYTAEDVPPEQFSAALQRFFETGGRGINCTVPLKELAYRQASRLSERAQRGKAVNTLVLEADGSLFGDNTDGAGLVRDLTRNLGLSLDGQRILILGAGGATRGILAPILALAPARLTIANRTAEKAIELGREFSDLGPVSGIGLDALQGDSYDLILNATTASLSGEAPPLPAGVLAEGGTCYDLAYGREPTAFVRWGEAAGASLSVDGLGMLVEQAAEAFTLWRGAQPDTTPVLHQLQAEQHRPA